MATLKDSGVLGNLVVSNQISAKNIKKNGSDVISTSDIGTGLSLSGTTINLNTASTSSYGGIKLYSNTDQTVAPGGIYAVTGRTYAVQLNSSNQAVVNVPWTDHNTTYSAGTGLSLIGTTFSVNVLLEQDIDNAFTDANK